MLFNSIFAVTCAGMLLCNVMLAVHIDSYSSALITAHFKFASFSWRVANAHFQL